MRSDNQSTSTLEDFSLSEIFTSFFKLKDWKKRTVYVGLPVATSFMLFAVSFGMFIILVMQDSPKTPVSVSLLWFFLYLISIPIMLLTSLSAIGYRIKHSESVRDGVELYNLYSVRNFLSRVKHAIILNIFFVIYQIVPIILIILGYFLTFVAIVMGDIETNASSIFIILSYILIIAGALLQTVIEFILYPLVCARYINASSRMDVANFLQTWSDFRKQISKILLIALLIYVLQSMILPIVYVLVIVFLVIGVVFSPFYLVFAGLAVLICLPFLSIGSVYSQHVQGEMIGSLARSIRNSS